MIRRLRYWWWQRKALYAINASYSHWERLSACATVDDIMAEGTGQLACELCLTFFDNVCERCPVKLYTGQFACGGTPYEDFSEAYHAGDMASCSRFANNERAFLLELYCNVRNGYVKP